MKSDYDENDEGYEGYEILDTWENLKVIGEEHIDIGAPNSTYKSCSCIFKDMDIEIFSKYVHFTFDSMKLMIGCIR